jgi:hypothetical protein
MTHRTKELLIEALKTAGIPRRISAWRAPQAKAIVAAILEPLVPAGTCQWLAHPERGESISHYAGRAISTAAARSSWAGGLRDGTQVSDRAVIESVAAVIRR